ncbi:uncharacterized protein YndB with AHSA1/START domain [Isoptericola jiangsuensis]|uniref:Uncharacterized protein YndB with AHSA1/START domain n=1 Tax=Isoptericola jiangsuensis TaxID=548579 RepID=A0A2A9EWW6_9MICO|nr:SRPBCC domain-containing protein [Isoptericola jiangsuensis]PFG43223.1 uncharacterized protein YndB with AHSA1/START domain [Isoptericola jiangsuensis]
MEMGTIERQLYVEATPEVVFAVVSEPEHVRRWWPDEADYPVEPGGTGTIGFATDDATITQRFTVLEVDPPRRFAFRWTHDDGEQAARGNSFLVVFELEPQGTGTRLSMTETGFRERGWAEAQVVAAYEDHVAGWDHFLPLLPRYAEQLEVSA